ncbi:MAG TPA: bacteriohemerythrin [Rhodocyclaceae bacterium]|nr:bacteriohemerythrin [Rhodocyclaceae bacterium]
MVDIRTLLIVSTLVLFCRAALLGYAWAINRTYEPARQWAVGSALIAAGVLLLSLRESISPFLSVFLAHALVLFGWMVTSAGTISAAEHDPPWRIGAGLIVATLAAVLWYLYVIPDIVARTIVLAVPGFLFDGYVIVTCLRFRGPRARRNSLRILAAVLAVSVVSTQVKNVHVAQFGLTTLFDATWEMRQYFLQTIVTLVVGTALYLLLAAQKTQEALAEEIERRKRAQESMRLASLVYEATSEGMIVTEADGTIITVNPAFTHLTGYAAEEVVGKTPSILKSGKHDEAFYGALWRDLAARGEWKGEIWNRHKDGTLCAELLSINTLYDAQGAAHRRVALFHDITRDKQSAEIIFHQANHDRLTGLANRYAFFEELAKELSRARRANEHVALLFMDLNRFKPVNDDYGHEAGDAVLKAVAERWHACLRSTDTLARIGGDEFALVVGGLPAREEAEGIARKLIHALAPPISIPGGQAVTVGTSVGVALYPENAMEMDSLIAAADSAMYRCKAGGHGEIAFSTQVAAASNADADWMVFGDAHLVGIAAIDAQHRTLVEMVNEINRSVRAGQEDERLRTLIGELVAFTSLHFATERRFMERYDFPDMAAHRNEHEDFELRNRRYVERFEPGDELRLLQMTKDWLADHIQGPDKILGAYLRSKGAS